MLWRLKHKYQEIMEDLFETALDILREEEKQRAIITLCRCLDSSIGGGIPAGIITELCGPPGSGKTQLCLQLCVNVQIPRSIGGVGGKAIFIDTTQGFNPNRVSEIADSCSKRYAEIAKNLPSTSSEEDFNADTILSGITYTYCRTSLEVIATVAMLKQRVKSQDDLKLIVVDSICFPFRRMENLLKRTRILQELLTDLQIMADNHSIAVVLTNDLTTRFDEDKQHYLCASLGDSHAHKIGQRIMLGRKSEDSEDFVAYLEKTVSSPPEYFAFKITESGVRDAD